jgi:hypothetical protein
VQKGKEPKGQGIEPNEEVTEAEEREKELINRARPYDNDRFSPGMGLG